MDNNPPDARISPGTGCRADWQAKVQSLLPPEEEVVKRNEKITALYANWYLKRPDLLKWAGLAAFASQRVGNALRLYESTRPEKDVARAVTGTGLYEADLELIRKTNNLVFADLGWAHQAYLDGGLAAVTNCLAGDAGYAQMLEGFREIDRGSAHLASAPDEAATLIWEGNLKLLKHEQFTTVQGQFANFQPNLFTEFLDRATTMDFDLELSTDFKPSANDRTSFKDCITREIPSRFQTLNIADVEQRWFWIDTEVWPLWKRVEKETSEFISARMKILAEETISEK